MTGAAGILIAQHDHVTTFSVTTGPDWLRVVLMAGVILVAAAAMLRPFVTVAGRTAQLAVTIAAAGVVLVLLLLADGLDMPQPAVVVVLIFLAVPLAMARHRGTDLRPGGGAPMALHAREVAPWVVLLATVVVAVELTRAWLGAGGPGGVAPQVTEQLVHTGLLIGVVGLSWLVLCRPRAPWLASTVDVAAWVLANLVLAGTTVVAVAGIPA